MVPGSTPAVAVPTTRATGVRPSRSTAASPASSTAAAPSLTPLAFPAVTVPPLRNGVGREASLSIVVSRGCSSRSTMTTSLRPATGTGTISRASRPLAAAAAARAWERRAKASWSARPMPSRAATFSAVSGMPSVPYAAARRGLTNRQPIVVSCTSLPRA